MRTNWVDAPTRELSVVVADEPMRSVLLEGYRATGQEAIAPQTPLDFVQQLLAAREHVREVVISSALRWAGSVRDFLADEYPDIEPVVLAS